ncbi:hypothetical protein TNCT_355781, partial [Trichonephila clavata]
VTYHPGVTSPHRVARNPLLHCHQMPPDDTQASKRMRRAGREGTGTQRINPFTIFELDRF